ncbi:BQ2448_5253 [Microbotryum intermedium]|uniref:BQ2448_5253 protein n=1 Tax=Microbotryum intermedium TaxID=269621 RepID=A0A238F0I1_9BASI|nr:BQ2448_5253 [Microbotryum intermedium]
MFKILSRLGFPRTTPSLPNIGISISVADRLDLDLAIEKDGEKDGSIEAEPAALRHVQINAAFVDVEDLDPEFLDRDGKERIIETAHDLSTRLVSLEDDATLPVHTIRMWTIGLGLTCFGAILGEILTFRPQVYKVSSLFLLGTGWHRILPKDDRGPFWAVLNPGPFSIKEHVCITVMASAGSSGALAISTFAVEKLYYNITPSYGIAIFTLIGEDSTTGCSHSSPSLSMARNVVAASQFFGYGLGGMYRSILVYPTFAVWPSLIPSVSLLETLHREKDLRSQRRRRKFFWIVFAGIFVWEWFPEIIAPTLTGISIFCLVDRTNPNLTRVFGGTNTNEGLGLFSIGFDWLQITSATLYLPWATMVSQVIGVVLCFIIIVWGYFGNVWNAKNFPFMGQSLFYEVSAHLHDVRVRSQNNTSLRWMQNGSVYDASLILDTNFDLNETALAEQVLYFGLNLSIGASFMHVFIWYRKDLFKAWRKWNSKVYDDPHYLKMQAYPDCPMWVYSGTALGAFVIALVTLYAGHSGMPWYALLIGAIFALIELPVLSIMTAVTGFHSSGSTLCQMLGSALVPGNARASLYFGLYSSNSVAQGSLMVKDLKVSTAVTLEGECDCSDSKSCSLWLSQLGQYTKVPPRAMFAVQAVGTLLGSVLNLVVMNSIVSSQRQVLLKVEGTNLWSGNVVQSYNTQVGDRMYGPHNKYFIIPLGIGKFERKLACVVLGLLVPLPFYIGHRFWPKLRLNQVVTPEMCRCLGYLSVGINSSVTVSVMLAIAAQFYLRRRRPTFFRKYNYLMAAALDGGTDFMIFVSTFTINGGAGKQYTFPHWALNPKDHYDCESSQNLIEAPRSDKIMRGLMIPRLPDCAPLPKFE